MPTYVMLSSLTPEGSKTVHSDPDRMGAVNTEIEGFGCKVVSQYALLGQYDFLTIVEAPDNETVAHLSVDLSSRGTIRILTLPAVEMEAFRTQLKGKSQLGHG